MGLGYLYLYFLDFFVLKTEYLPRLNINKVVMMVFGYFFIARTTISKIMAFQNIGLLP